MKITEEQKKFRTYLVVICLILFIIFLIGIFWLASGPAMTVGLALTFAAGLSMIVLPCTFPLVFVIVPLSMGKGYKKGLIMALLFGFGLTITLTLYGVFVAIGGKALGLHKVQTIMFLIAGIAAWIFGLAELELIKLKIPSFGGATPRIIQKQGDFIKALLMGLFLGNAGIACPNPATYVILTYIAGSGSVAYGAALQAVNGLGRSLPLIALSILGILGVSATGWLIKKKKTINRITGWGLAIIGAIIIVWGVYGHYWFLNTPVHKHWTRSFGKIAGGIAEYECCIEPGCTMCLEGRWIWPENTCKCRIALENNEMDKVCPECLKGLEEGKGVYDIAERTQWPATGLLIILIIIPIIWYSVKGFTRRSIKKPKKREVKK